MDVALVHEDFLVKLHEHLHLLVLLALHASFHKHLFRDILEVLDHSTAVFSINALFLVLLVKQAKSLEKNHVLGNVSLEVLLELVDVLAIANGEVSGEATHELRDGYAETTAVVLHFLVPRFVEVEFLLTFVVKKLLASDVGCLSVLIVEKTVFGKNVEVVVDSCKLSQIGDVVFVTRDIEAKVFSGVLFQLFKVDVVAQVVTFQLEAVVSPVALEAV